MKKHLINFLLIFAGMGIILGGLLTYRQYTKAQDHQVEEVTAIGDTDNSLPLTVIEEDSSLQEEEEVTKDVQPVKEEIEPVKLGANYPGDLLDLANWKQTLPTGSAKSPTEIKQPALAGFASDPYFRLNSSKDGVICRAPVDGVTTSGSGYPRSELREMKNGGKENASWSTTSGTHTMYIDQAITAVPKNKRHVVAGQVHDADDDVIVIRLEYPKLFVDINGETGPTLDSNYILGKRFNVKFVAENGQIKIYYNGGEKPVHTLDKKTSGCYFKAGAYTQSNCSKESDCSKNNYGEVIIYDLKVTH